MIHAYGLAKTQGKLKGAGVWKAVNDAIKHAVDIGPFKDATLRKRMSRIMDTFRSELDKEKANGNYKSDWEFMDECKEAFGDRPCEDPDLIVAMGMGDGPSVKVSNKRTERGRMLSAVESLAAGQKVANASMEHTGMQVVQALRESQMMNKVMIKGVAVGVVSLFKAGQHPPSTTAGPENQRPPMAPRVICLPWHTPDFASP
eukprot:jgi/Mesvir1/7103/Mv09209-RA.1